jgi:hypothetical protein
MKEQLDIKAEKYIKQHNEKNLTELEEGDLVRIRHFLYDHWLVYIGTLEFYFNFEFMTGYLYILLSEMLCMIS